MVPMINTAKEAAAVVTYSKFPPYGLRGQGSAFPAIGHGLTTPEYMKTANETILTIVQIETKQGVENVEEIAAVPGIGESLLDSHQNLKEHQADTTFQITSSSALTISLNHFSATLQPEVMNPSLSRLSIRL